MPRFNGTPVEAPKPRFAGKPVAQTGQHLSFEEGEKLLAAQAQQQRMDGASGTVGAAVTGFADGVPIVGPGLLSLGQRGAALASTAINGGTFDENLDAARSITQDAQQAHPYVTTGANVAGAVAGTLPAVAAAPAAFGAGSRPLLQRSIMSAITGGAIGGADAGVRSGGDVEAMQEGARWGAGMGFAGPAVGSLVGKGARGLANFVRSGQIAKTAGTSRNALAALDDTLAADGLDATAAQARLNDLGPDGMFADLGPSTQSKAAGLAAIPGRAQEMVRGAVDARASGANSRIAATVDSTMGRNIIPSEVDAGLMQNQQLLGNQYGEAFKKPIRYDFTPITDDLDKSIQTLRGDAQRRLKQVRGMLDVHNTNQVSVDPRVAFQTRQAIDGMLATEADPKVIAALSDARQMIDDGLRDSVPRIKEIDANYAELARQRDALTRGQSVLDHGRTAPRPPELAAEIQDGALPQNLQVGPSAVPLRLSQGARAEVDRILGSNANDVAALNRLIKGEGDWNRSRLASLFGEDKADQLFKTLDNELTFARTRNTITGNSETARRQQAIASIDGRDSPDLMRNSYAAGGIAAIPRAAGVKVVDKILNTMLKGRTESANANLADLLSGNRNDVVQALAMRQGLPTSSPMIERLTRAILLGGGTSGAR
ncbi:hypothetical protein [Agrobacterium rubi]|uniref:Uncharacterized protein n=1 Tax=Agrobacterium rubi TaxID=28099 RepID=A0ABX2IXU9_9HYPH|nr:hypothetical protein [Agrobacterium rubi]NTF35569.1 hypothetical protein [Agrobacterium rubi]